MCAFADEPGKGAADQQRDCRKRDMPAAMRGSERCTPDRPKDP